MSARVLVLTAGFGEGHNAAARALAAACDAVNGAGTAQVFDAFAAASPRFNRLLRHAYLGLINRAPGLWSMAYGWLDRSSLSPALMRRLWREKRALISAFERERPELLCSTYPAYPFLLAELARERRCRAPHYTIVTDSISINSVWWRAGSAGWFLANQDSADVLRAAGIEESRLHVMGFPVSEAFADLGGQLVPPDLRQGGAPRVLYIVNSRTPAALATARRLLTDTNWEITCTVGGNAALAKELAELARQRRHPTNILGWTDQIPRLLLTHHVVISKAGGATTQEALAARCPMIVNQIVPGQEQGNYELLRRHGIGALAESPEAVLAALERAFADRGMLWRQWRQAIGPISRANAARDIAAFVLGRSSRAEREPVSPRPMATPA